MPHASSKGRSGVLFHVFVTKLRFDLKSEASKVYLGNLWWVLEPALFVAVFYLVFGVLLHRGTEDFLVFLLCGKIPFLWFSKSVTGSSDSIFGGRGLINQISIPKPFFPLLTVCEGAVKEIFVFALLLLFLLLYGTQPTLYWLLIVPVALVQLLLIITCALASAAITPFLPDFRYVVATGMTMLMFGSGIFYSYTDLVSEAHRELFLLNPMAALIECYRAILMRAEPPLWGHLGAIALLSVAAAVALLRFYRRFDATYARLVIQ